MSSTELVEVIVATLFATIALQFVATRLALPPAAALLGGGALLAFIPGLPTITLDPELVLVIFLPPLLMDGAWFIAIASLRRHLIGILSLAIGAVLFTTVAVAIVAHAVLPELPWAACAVLGAIVSPPDAVSARAVLQRVTLPRRLSILLEGESLLNDATGLVLFRFGVAAGVTGLFSLQEAAQSFAWLAVGGILVGLAVSGLWALVVPRLRDDYLMIAASCLVCWAAYLISEMAHVSGVIATVTCGLFCGWQQHVLFPASVRRRGTSFWTVMIFLMEALVFMLIGLSLRGVIERVGGFSVVIERMLVPVVAIIVAITVARFVWVFASDAVIMLGRALGIRRYTPLGPRSASVLSWAGMRGVVTLAMALSVPESFPGRDFILVAAFAVILVTVVLQGTTLGAIIRLARLDEEETDRPRLTLSQAEAAMADAQLRAVERLAYDSEGTLIHPQLLDRYRRKASHMANYAGREGEFSDALHAHFAVVLHAIGVGRTELIRLHRSGEIDEATLQDLERDLDLEELSALSNLT